MGHDQDKYIGSRCHQGEHSRCLAEECECRCHVNAEAGILPQRVTDRY